jgi:hypothetical protein
VTAVLAALIGACASVPPAPPPPSSQPPPQQALPRGALPARARYLAYAGAPIDHFNWLGPINGWEPLSDNELVVFVGANGAYMLTVWSPCGLPGLSWVNRIEIRRSIAGAVYARFDAIRLEHTTCPISEIRPIDYKRMLRDGRMQRATQPPAAPAAQPAPPPAATAPAPQ